MTIAAVNDTFTYKGAGGDTERPAQLVGVRNPDGTIVGSSALGTGTDKSGSVTLGGTAQVLAAANTARVMLVGQNIDPGEDMWINEIGGTAAAATAGSWLIPAKGTFSIDTTRAVSVVAATTGHKWTAEEF